MRIDAHRGRGKGSRRIRKATARMRLGVCCCRQGRIVMHQLSHDWLPPCGHQLPVLIAIRPAVCALWPYRSALRRSKDCCLFDVTLSSPPCGARRKHYCNCSDVDLAAASSIYLHTRSVAKSNTSQSSSKKPSCSRSSSSAVLPACAEAPRLAFLFLVVLTICSLWPALSVLTEVSR